MKIDKKKLQEEALRALQEQYPHLNIQAGLDHASEVAREPRFSQAGEADKLVLIIKKMADAFAGHNGEQIAKQIKAMQPADAAAKLKGPFERRVSHLVKRHRDGRLSLPKALQAAGGKISVAVTSSSIGPAIIAHAATTNVANREAGEVDHNATPPASKPATARGLKDGLSTKSTGAEDSATAVPQPALLPLDDQPALRAAHAMFTGSFAGSVYKSGHPAVGEFFDAVKKSASKTDLRQLALRIQGDEAARAAMETINVKDRAFYEQALAAA